VPRAEAEATPIGESYLKNLVDELAEQIVTTLDRTTPVEQSLNRLFPETRAWVFQMSTDSQFMQAAFWPRGSAVPVLPENAGRLKDVRLELWLHSTATEAQDLVKLSKVTLHKNLIHRYLETLLPELAAFAENRSVDSVGPWLVISIGAPKADLCNVDNCGMKGTIRRKMSDNKDRQRSEADAELEREIRKGREFTLDEAIGRMAGPGAMKGVSPVTGLQQAAVVIENWLRHHMSAGNGDLEVVLLRRVKESELLLNHFDQPLVVLAAFCQQVLDSDYLLKELVREADVEWGRVQGERPYFEREGSPPDPDDPYTLESVRRTLAGLIEQLGAGDG
jgi:hypothetical protein